MTRHTLGRRALVAIAGMATHALHFRVLVAERKARLAVIELGVQPGNAAMTSGAVRTQLPLVRLVLLVTGHTGRRGFAILLAGLMTACASHRQMRIAQWKIRALMIELFGNELDDIGVAPLVLGVATLTLQRGSIRQTSVKSGLFLHVVGNILVTVQTQAGLADFIGAVVTAGTGAFQLGMRATHLAGHQQGFNARRRSDVKE